MSKTLYDWDLDRPGVLAIQPDPFSRKKRTQASARKDITVLGTTLIRVMADLLKNDQLIGRAKKDAEFLKGLQEIGVIQCATELVSPSSRSRSDGPTAKKSASAPSMTKSESSSTKGWTSAGNARQSHSSSSASKTTLPKSEAKRLTVQRKSKKKN